ncbi:hypothetical protein KI688_010370 [Linnemannia hyalina]|uniref:Uncharacterized protein n=1 Tax=Linnemannia hyalina TaxID=64524 RepID=A0A9P7XYH8_9FUNG|nr:hypothetical protein KI688_010370 [Linnemannia hyalina]
MPQVVRAHTGQLRHCRISNRVFSVHGRQDVLIVPSPSIERPFLAIALPEFDIALILDFDPAFTVSSSMIKELQRFCPLLTGYQLEDHNSTIIPKFLKSRFTGNGDNNNISEITFKYRHTTVKGIAVILLHETSFKTLIPRGCLKIRAIDLHYHEMDMDIVKQGAWICKNQPTLRVRIKDLDIKDKILTAVAFWRAGYRRRWQKNITGTAMAAEEQAQQGRELD